MWWRNHERGWGLVTRILHTAAIGPAVLLAVHVAVALKHHFLDRDDVLKRMLVDR